MSDTRHEPSHLRSRERRRTRRWHWQTAVAALVALLCVEGQPVVASHATVGSAAPNVRPASATSRLTARDASASAGASRPDFSIAVAHLDEARAGQPFSYTLQVRNTGTTGSAVSVRTGLPPGLSNVRVTAPGFACTRQFAAGGQQPGTLVMCMRNDLESGHTADVTVEANVPSAGGSFQITAVADPRDDVSEIDEANNAASITVQIDA